MAVLELLARATGAGGIPGGLGELFLREDRTGAVHAPIGSHIALLDPTGLAGRRVVQGATTRLLDPDPPDLHVRMPIGRLGSLAFRLSVSLGGLLPDRTVLRLRHRGQQIGDVHRRHGWGRRLLALHFDVEEQSDRLNGIPVTISAV